MQLTSDAEAPKLPEFSTKNGLYAVWRSAWSYHCDRANATRTPNLQELSRRLPAETIIVRRLMLCCPPQQGTATNLSMPPKRHQRASIVKFFWQAMEFHKTPNAPLEDAVAFCGHRSHVNMACPHREVRTSMTRNLSLTDMGRINPEEYSRGNLRNQDGT